MSITGNIFGILLYALAALTAATALPWTETPLGGTSPSLIALGIFALLVVAHEVYVHRTMQKNFSRRQDMADHEIACLRREMLILRRDAAQWREAAHTEDMATLRKLLNELARRVAAKERPAPRQAVIDADSDMSEGPIHMPHSRLEILEILRRALEENLIDLYLQPIVSLPQRKIRYYECFSRIRALDGSLLSPQEYLATASESGMMTAIDNLLLFRCVQLIRRLRKRRKNTGFFINLARPTIEDISFVEQFIIFLEDNPDLTGQLYFEISQTDYDLLSPQAEDVLNRLAILGCHFSLDNVTSLNIDLGELERRQFKFMKLSANALLSDVYQSGASIDVAELTAMLAKHGISLIAEKIETEQTVINLLDFEVDYAQGYLFGEPRRSRDNQ